MDWHEYFFTLGYNIASKSKDKSTNFGAVIIDDDHNLISTGYNSFPRGINDYDERRQEKPYKYYFFEHAERNSIYGCARTGVSCKGCYMYIQTMPCADCARAIIQAGIVKLYIHKEWTDMAGDSFGSWNESQKAAEEMLKEAGVDIVEWSGKIYGIECKIRGKQIDVINI